MKRSWNLALLVLVLGCSEVDTGVEHAPSGSEFLARLTRIVAACQGRAPVVEGGLIQAGAVGGEASQLPQNWRAAEAHLYLGPDGPQNPDAPFLFPGQGAAATSIVINSVAPTKMQAQISCDQTARLYGVGARPLHMRPGKSRKITLGAGSHGDIRLAVGPEVTQCQISWGEGHSLSLRREALARPDLARLDARESYCSPPDPGQMNALEATFYSDRWLSQTCAHKTGQVRLVEGQLEALNVRVEALMGAQISEARLLAGDPDMALDFSNAPKLELIYISYLLMRADYSGFLLTRMLDWHAARGTIVRIIVTDALMQAKDRALFEALAAAHPNVQIQYFAWQKPGVIKPTELVDMLQKAHHIKVFATLSADPGRSRFIVGGRNTWDGFFFDHPIDLSAYPDLRTYSRDDPQALIYYSVYKDFEIELQGDAVTADFMAHLSTFWHRDMTSQTARVMSVTGRASGPVPVAGQVRHFMSLPWADGQAQEAYFVDLFDSARAEITIVTPFLYPPVNILNAMLRARARGVVITVIARIASTDPSGKLVSGLSRGFVQKWAGHFEIFEHAPGPLMTHTKLILIDGQLSVVTSTNMNRRSFLHDSENGLVFLDQSVTAKLQQVVDGYLATASRLQPGQPLEPLERAINAATDLWQYF